MPDPAVLVSIVTYNSEPYIGRCLDAVLRQEGAHLDIVVVDNASTDGTRRILASFGHGIRVLENRRNTGFAAAQNQAMAQARTPWVLVLNPDVLLAPGFLRGLLEAAALDARAGTLCGKLLSIGPGFEPLPQPLIDSTGIYFTPAMRHFDRGARQPDDGRYERPEYVFGASAAAALYRREMIDEVSADGEFFDPDFFAYREDADVAWRAQLLGWRSMYTPAAVAWHVRTAWPDNRRTLPPWINMHSVKNRFLLRIKNLTTGVSRRCWRPMTGRDLFVIAGCLFTEPRSLEAFWRLAQCWRRALARRRWIMTRRRASDDTLARWFSFQPVAFPVGAAPADAAPEPLPVAGYLKRSSIST